MSLDEQGVGLYSSSSLSKRKCKYEVFLSFRGEDTRKTFTDHLYDALCRKNLKTFRDKEELERGESIKSSLKKAIEESLSAIVVLSKNYATSTWCLDELLHILHSNRKLDLHVFPIFYRIRPSDVRKQTGSFGEAFENLERKHGKKKVREWRKALGEVANLAGWDYKDYWYETELIQDVVNKVRSKLKRLVGICKEIFEDVERGTCMKFDGSDNRDHRNNFNLETGYSKGCIFSTTDLVGEEFQSYTKQIWKWIMEDEVSAIGIWGMGGVGKTILAVHMNNKLLEEAYVVFDHIIWITASQYGNSIYKLQKAIASSINLDISDECDTKRISGKLLQASKLINRSVLILDDVWDPILLKEVGFPISNNGIKLILTTRSREVCQLMDCKKDNIIELKPLDGEEGWDLFKSTLEGPQGQSHQIQSSGLEPIARAVSRHCWGLPLAIVMIANSMKGNTNIRDWNHLLECLQNWDTEQYCMNKKVFPILKSSYACLNDTSQSFFLYYALRGKEHVYDNYVEPLVRRFFFDRWIDKTKSFVLQYDKGCIILDGLKCNCLLTREYEKEYGRWRMHTLLRVMGINIAKETGKIMVKTGMDLEELPENEEWKENLQKVFLTESNIQKISDGSSPKCSKLSMLLLDCNCDLKWIPDDFFRNMPTLKILDLSRTGIKRLPESISNLECLVALLVSGCEELSCVPSLAKLQRLIELDLSFTAITEAPCGLELLVNLKCLNLEYTDQLNMSLSAIAQLINLQILRLMNCIPKSMAVSAKDLQGLRNLEVVSVNFCDIKAFNDYVTGFLDKDHKLKSYCLSLATVFDYTSLMGAPKAHSLKRVVLCGIDLANSLAVLPEDINELLISNCELKDLEQIAAPVAPFLDSQLLCLRDLQICKCSRMKILMMSDLLALLQNLETISIESCESMVEVIGKDCWGSDTYVTHPKVRSVKLRGLARLTWVFKGTIYCPSLKYFRASSCEKLCHPKIEIIKGNMLQMKKIWTGYTWNCDNQAVESTLGKRKWRSWM